MRKSHWSQLTLGVCVYNMLWRDFCVAYIQDFTVIGFTDCIYRIDDFFTFQDF